MPISEVFSADIGLGGVLSLLWFRRRLPDYATKFIEMILMVRYDMEVGLQHWVLRFFHKIREGAFLSFLSSSGASLDNRGTYSCATKAT